MEGWKVEWLKGWKVEWLKGWMIERLKGWKVERLKGWKVERLKGWKVEWLKGWKVERLKGWKVERLKGYWFALKNYLILINKIFNTQKIIQFKFWDESSSWNDVDCNYNILIPIFFWGGGFLSQFFFCSVEIYLN